MTNQNPMIEEMKDFAQGLTGSPEVMKDRDKGDLNEILNTTATIKEFDFMSGDQGDYAVIALEEEPNKFFFGGKLLTENLQEMVNKGFTDAIYEYGLPVKFGKQKSRSTNRTYTTVEFYPEQ